MKRRIYLDNASTTPLDAAVLKVMRPYLEEEWGNPSALYKEGQMAKRVVTESRTRIAKLLNIRSEEIIFTASGTEADNLTILGMVAPGAGTSENFGSARTPSTLDSGISTGGGRWERRKFSDVPAPGPNTQLHVVTTNIEHPGILEACKEFERHGGEVTCVPVEENGIVDPKKVVAAIKPNTILISVMYANNEIGTVQPLREISRLLQKIENHPYLHSDASQAPNYLTLNFQALGVDMMTLDASKVYGPKGVGLLAAKRHVPLRPIVFGGGQEKGLRAGTENVAGIVGIAKALEVADKMREKESKRLSKLRDYFFREILKIIPNVITNGDRGQRLPNNINICILGLDAEFAVIKLDRLGIACSSASSCLNLSENSYSYVVDALGKTGPTCRESSLRFSLGRSTEKSDIDSLLRILPKVL